MPADRKRQAADEGVAGAIEFFTNENSSTKTRGNDALSRALEDLESQACDHGLSGDHIIQLLDVACSGRFPENVNTKLIKKLIPSTTVPETAALKAVSWMCTNKPSSAIQALLVKWLVLVYEYLESTDKLHSLYMMIFYFLEDEIMCPHVCHLLYLLTRKEDVKAFRVRSLIQLQNKMGQQAYIQGLLSIYKLFCPHLVSISITRSVFFRQTDRNWSAKIQRVQSLRQKTQPVEPDPLMERLRAQPAKRRRSEVIPMLTADANVNNHKRSKLSPTVPFSHIRSFREILKYMDRLELPNQLAVALRDVNLQHVLLCYPDPAIPLRLSHWLDHVLHQEFIGQAAQDEKRCDELLRKLIWFSDFMQEGVPVCEHFLTKYLHVWNGTDHRSKILKLITRFRIQPYPFLYDLVLEPLRKLFFCSSVYFKCQVLVCLTELLRNFASVEYERYMYSRQLQAERNDVRQSVLHSHDHFSVFSEEVRVFSALDTISSLIDFVNNITTIGLQAENNHALLMHFVLSFFETASTLYLTYKVPVVVLMSPGPLHSALFSNDAMCLSRLCLIINNYREIVSELRTNDKLKVYQTQVKKQVVPHLNGYILDSCDSLWRGKALQKSMSQHSIFHLLADYDTSRIQVSDVSNAFSFYLHQALLGFSYSFLKQTQPKDSNVHPKSLKQVKDILLEYLTTHHVVGVPKFISTNINRSKSKHATPQKLPDSPEIQRSRLKPS